MSDIDTENTEMKEMIIKMSRYNKNTKALMELIGKSSEKLDELLDWKRKEKTSDVDDEKEKMDKIFEKKNIGRPKGSFEDKQKQYLKMLNEKKISQPKIATMEFYRIQQDGDKYVLY